MMRISAELFFAKSSLVRLLALLVALMSGLPQIASGVPLEVRVYDNLGVLRIARPITSIVQVTVELDGSAPSEIGTPTGAMTLVNSVGLAPDVSGKELSPGKFIFHGVGNGSWKISTSTKKVLIKNVEIVEE